MKRRTRKLQTIYAPVARQMRKAYRSTRVYQVDKLLDEQRRWKRKQTIATNKLEAVRKKLEKLAIEHARELTQLKGSEDHE